MRKTRKKVRTTKIKELIIPAKGYAILRTTITKGKNEYVFYDIQYGSVIITGCRVIEGKNGDFLAMPSRESNGEYYPVVYLSHELGDQLMSWIEDADDDEDWEEVDDDFYLRHVEDEKPKKKTKRKTKTVVEDDEDDEDEDDEDDEEEEEKPKKKAKTKTQQNKKKAAADDTEDYPF